MKVIDLRVDSKLIKTNFDGYKLSLKPIAILKIENINKVHRRIANSSSEYGFLHSYLFQLHNHFYGDPFLCNTSYYIDETYNVNKISYDSNSGKLKPLTSVYKFKSIQNDEIEGKYNMKLKFVSEKYCLLSDGIGGLQIIDTGDRQKNDEWKKIDSLQPLFEGKGFILQDCKFKIESGEKVIHCLLLYIKQEDDKFYNFVNWITLKEESSTKKWTCVAKRILKGKGTLYYLSFDPHCNAIVYSSNHAYKYIEDNVNEIVEEQSMEITENEEMQAADSHTFQWTQNGEDITINFNRIPDATNDMYHVKSLQSHIEVRCGQQILVKSDLFAEIDVDLTTWTLENDFIQVNLIKRNPDLIWPYLIPSGPMETSQNNSNQPMNLFNTQPVADLNSQMEECDFGDDGNQDDEYFIERLDSVTHKATHKIFLGSNHPLFSKTLRPGFPKAIAIRNDVDCCLWIQQQISPNDEWTLKHEGTLHAFGYVQASKRDKKYLMCSMDMNLSVICESSRHLFIYKNSYSTASGLRKRNGPQVQIGQQKVISFDDVGEIYGINVENEIIMLLTENSIMCLQLAEEE
ncbi:hypothetical protein PVAND_002123 [Polypedilum vanderplanki]|uniref:NudC domain-containing protein 1 n=1 Tax=Polypedilum vanderplanki TaxID=319348 RepID=A0A9J6BQK5_POLVA|nr:hypothetical protein PVAND_002123 [Polypedilum vanderplanki]